MLTNFDLIWLHVRQLIDKLMEEDGGSIDEELFSTYCTSFEQLIQVIESEPDSVTDEKLDIVRLYLASLEERYGELKKEIQKKISEERLKALTLSKYSSAGGKENLFNKKT
ncbi:MAG: hypothetical protein LBD73_07700 [Deferribacteraceae bacterium]|jgi:flagellin-specific chaperone FliS|nr:hypothetical protein [Deferribacteraceae bacterium]